MLKLIDGSILACVKLRLTVAQINSHLSLLRVQRTVDIVQVCDRQKGRTDVGETLLAAPLAALLASFGKCDVLARTSRFVVQFYMLKVVQVVKSFSCFQSCVFRHFVNHSGISA